MEYFTLSLQLDNQDIDISWLHIVDLYQWDLGMNRDGFGLRVLPKFQEEYIKLTPANISTSDQSYFSFVDQRWNNIDPPLKMKQNPTSDFQSCTTLI